MATLKENATMSSPNTLINSIAAIVSMLIIATLTLATIEHRATVAGYTVDWSIDSGDESFWHTV